eukprot:GHVR01101808.1.p1 GENE.GHVR01101808.1~~GHVR01101808.1.p1  ORF type:complete len:309 (-),score=36.12 GHVR01101808.1:154-1080(-)
MYFLFLSLFVVVNGIRNSESRQLFNDASNAFNLPEAFGKEFCEATTIESLKTIDSLYEDDFIGISKFAESLLKFVRSNTACNPMEKLSSLVSDDGEGDGRKARVLYYIYYHYYHLKTPENELGMDNRDTFKQKKESSGLFKQYEKLLHTSSAEIFEKEKKDNKHDPYPLASLLLADSVTGTYKDEIYNDIEPDNKPKDSDRLRCVDIDNNFMYGMIRWIRDATNDEIDQDLKFHDELFQSFYLQLLYFASIKDGFYMQVGHQLNDSSLSAYGTLLRLWYKGAALMRVGEFVIHLKLNDNLVTDLVCVT